MIQDYEMPWRKVYESYSAIGWLLCFFGNLYIIKYTTMPKAPFLITCVASIILFVYRLYQSDVIWHRKLNLMFKPLDWITSHQIKQIIEKTNNEYLYLGTGYNWNYTHTQRNSDIRETPDHLLVPPAWYFKMHGRKIRKSVRDDSEMGNPLIHGIETNYKDIIDILLINARNYYEQNVNNKEINTEKVTCYIWDEYYWDDIYKRKKRSLNTVHLNENANKVFKDMKDFLSDKTEKEYEYLGLPYKRNYLFEGYPGTGKTSLIYSLASELNMDVAIIHFNNDIDDIKFTKAMMKIPKNTLLILEDIDVLFNENRKKNDINKNKITLSGLLNILDGLMHQEKQIIIMTTNFKCTLDNALQRPGRIDYILHFDFATKNQINAMFDKFLPNQSERFVEFYKLIKNINITTATLQQFLFQNRITENIIDKIDELDNK